MRTRVTILDLPFHRRTKSSSFFIRLLETKFEVSHVYYEGSQSLEAVSEFSPSIVICWQVMPPAEKLVKLGIPTVWVPMYDQNPICHHQNFCEAAMAGIPILAFSEAISEFARFWGAPTLGVRYYPVPVQSSPVTTSTPHALFWYRGAVHPADFEHVFDRFEHLNLTIKHDPDPGYELEERRDGNLSRFQPNVVEGFLTAEDYRQMMDSVDIYIAPRRLEGIGLSFLEPMSKGALIIGYDAPTQNEYIRHGVNGWLFSASPADPLEPDRVGELRVQSHKNAIEGYENWLAKTEEILEFLEDAKSAKWRVTPKALLARAISTYRRFKSGRKTD